MLYMCVCVRVYVCRYEMYPFFLLSQLKRRASLQYRQARRRASLIGWVGGWVLYTCPFRLVWGTNLRASKLYFFLFFFYNRPIRGWIAPTRFQQQCTFDCCFASRVFFFFSLLLPLLCVWAWALTSFHENVPRAAFRSGRTPSRYLTCLRARAARR